MADWLFLLRLTVQPSYTWSSDLRVTSTAVQRRIFKLCVTLECVPPFFPPTPWVTPDLWPLPLHQAWVRWQQWVPGTVWRTSSLHWSFKKPHCVHATGVVRCSLEPPWLMSPGSSQSFFLFVLECRCFFVAMLSRFIRSWLEIGGSYVLVLVLVSDDLPMLRLRFISHLLEANKLELNFFLFLHI